VDSTQLEAVTISEGLPDNARHGDQGS